MDEILARYVQAHAECIAIARRVGIRNCDDSPEWRAAEKVADGLYEQALASGHTPDDILAAVESQT